MTNQNEIKTTKISLATLEYAKLNIERIAEDNSISVYIINESKLYIQTIRGINFSLSEEEIKNQASEYLRSEIEKINSIH
jgi:hypothetical protein